MLGKAEQLRDRKGKCPDDNPNDNKFFVYALNYFNQPNISINEKSIHKIANILYVKIVNVYFPLDFGQWPKILFSYE